MQGIAYTLITKKEDKFAGDLVANLRLAGQVSVYPLWLHQGYLMAVGERLS